jgi:hypothetical protein
VSDVTININGNTAAHSTQPLLLANTQVSAQQNGYSTYYSFNAPSSELTVQVAYLNQGQSYEVTIEATDPNGNSDLIALDLSALALGNNIGSKVVNYPNPFSDTTFFGFTIDQPAEVKIYIFNTSGEILKTIEGDAIPGWNGAAFSWDGRDEWGNELGNGGYLFVLEAKKGDGKKVVKRGKLAILR